MLLKLQHVLFIIGCVIGSIGATKGGSYINLANGKHYLKVNEKPAELRLTDVRDLVALMFGMTPDNKLTSFNGLTVKNPFQPVKSVDILVIEGDDLPPSQTHYNYGVLVDMPTDEFFKNLASGIKRKSLKSVNVNMKNVTLTNEPESLKQLHKIGDLSTRDNVGKNVQMVAVSLQTKDQGKLAEAAEQVLVEQAKQHPDGVFITLRINTQHRRTRRALATGMSAVPSSDLNLATVYSGDYPVVFNIILILSIIMGVSVLAVSVSMATMDPGRDSIIYRMTNPRMKKDQ